MRATLAVTVRMHGPPNLYCARGYGWVWLWPGLVGKSHCHTDVMHLVESSAAGGQ